MEATDGRIVSQIGLSVAVERLLRAGFHVAVPIVDDGYDLLAFDGRRHWRVQVKASSAAPKTRNSYRIDIGRGFGKYKRYDPAHVDAFICVNLRTNAVMCLPVASTINRRFINWSEAPKWGDVGIIRSIKTQRC